MADDDAQRPDDRTAHPNEAIKDPDDWVTGDEPMTEAQESYLGTLARQTGEEVDDDLTKAEASKEIDRLRDERGAG
ncbi:MAG: DUF3072 domain-containing protein [Acidimicrobiales bacterium]